MDDIKKAKIVEGSVVLLRLDVNEPVDSQGFPLDTFRIEKMVPTILYCLERKAKLILISHLGNPEGQSKAQFSLVNIASILAKLVGQSIRFLDKLSLVEVKSIIQQELQPEQIVMLQNLRFDPREEQNSPELAQELACLAEIYINDAFSVSHRAHASIDRIKDYIPAYMGLTLAKEVEVLDGLLHHPVSPSIAIIGGAKIQTKLAVIQALAKTFDYVLVGGKVANEYLDLYTRPESDRIILPIDFFGAERYDIGPKTRQLFASYIQSAATIVWNGPMGWFEQPPYDQGTRFVVEAIAKNQTSYSVIGGGETVDEVYNLHRESKIDFISTGGGAMLEYIASAGNLIGLRAKT